MTAQRTAPDHDAAQRLAATAIDWPLSPAEDAELEAHLRDCPSCRARVAALQGDARALRLLDLGNAPASVRARVAVHAGRTLRRQRGLGRGTAWLAAAALVLVTVGASIVGGVGGDGGRTGPGESAGPSRAQTIVFETEVVTLAARELWIEAGGQRFVGAAIPQVHSDPGNATFRTLEVTWREHGVEMRLNLYFGGDAESWWVDEVRTYNGARDGQWLYARGPLFRTSNGAAWAGDVDIPLVDRDGVGGTPARLHIAGGLLAVRPFDGVSEPLGGGIELGPNDRLFERGGRLYCSGILQMAPRDAERVLLSLGYKLSWRLATGDGGFWDVRSDAPEGTIMDTGTLTGSEGELIIAVVEPGGEGGGPIPFPADCPPLASESP